MHNQRFASLIALFIFSACAGSAPIDPSPDASIDAPLDPSGRYAVISTYSLAAPPPEAAALLDELRSATDGPDDPSRYLIDLMIARLPEGRVRTYAAALAPYLAAYINGRITEVAPKFVDGARALALGLSRTAHRFGTRETFELDTVGRLRRTIIGFQLDQGAGYPIVTVPFDGQGLPDVTVMTHATVTGDQLAIDRAPVTLPYAALLRFALDRAVIPPVVQADDLAGALNALVDCPHLGELVATWLGIGSADFYARACSAGLTMAAARIYARIDQIDPLVLDLAGTARVVEGGLAGGTWAGASATGSFEGDRQ